MKQLKIVKFYTTFRITQLSFIYRRWMSTHVTQLKTSSRNWLTRSVSRVWTGGPSSKQWSNLHQTTRPAITRVAAIIVKNRSRRLRSTFHSTVSSTMSYHRYNVFKRWLKQFYWAFFRQQKVCGFARILLFCENFSRVLLKFFSFWGEKLSFLL